MSPQTLWNNCLKDVNRHISPQHFATWFKPIRLLGESGGTLELEVPNRFFLDWIKEHYLQLIEDVLGRVSKSDCHIKWKISEDMGPAQAIEGASGPGGAGSKATGAASGSKAERAASKGAAKGTTGSTKRARTDHNLSERYTFDNFVVGKANEFAHAACSAITSHLGSKYNPLFIYGGVGLGKTHLLQAIGNKLIKEAADIRVCYYTSERFMNEFIKFVSRHKMDDFRKKFRNVDILLIDDIQFWSGKEGTQEEFFHTFNTLYEAHKQVVVTSDKFPKDLDGIEERLRSRFEWGLVADIQPPDTETKVAIVKNKALKENIELPDDVAFWLAGFPGSNIRELEGYLNRIFAVSSLTGKEITLENSKEALRNITKEKDSKRVSIQDIQKMVCSAYGIRLADIKSKKRHKTIALPRQVAMYLAREYGKSSYPEIGSAFGGKNHSTAIHAVKKITAEIEKDPELKGTIRTIKKDLGLI